MSLSSGPGWGPDGAGTATDEVFGTHRVLEPVRAGGLLIGLVFTAVFIVALILRSIAFSL